MADETLKRDQNFITVLGGVTDDANQFVTMLRVDPTSKRLKVSATGLPGGGDVVGPASATDNAIARFDTTTGKLLQNSVVTIGDTGAVRGPIAIGIGKNESASIRLEILTNGTFTQGVRVEGDLTTRLGFSSFVTADAQVRFTNNIAGLHAWGDGASVADTNLYRSAADVLKTDDAFQALSFNGLTVTTTTGTFTLTNAKTFAVTNTITLSGTDSTVMTFPTTTATIARTDAGQTFTGTQTFSQIITTNNAISASGNAATVPITSRLNTVTNNSAATLTITLTTTSAVDGALSMIRILDFSAVAQTITWVNTENSTVTAPVTSNGSTTLPLTVGFQYNAATSKWRCIASA